MPRWTTLTLFFELPPSLPLFLPLYPSKPISWPQILPFWKCVWSLIIYNHSQTHLCTESKYGNFSYSVLQSVRIPPALEISIFSFISSLSIGDIYCLLLWSLCEVWASWFLLEFLEFDIIMLLVYCILLIFSNSKNDDNFQWDVIFFVCVSGVCVCVSVGT